MRSDRSNFVLDQGGYRGVVGDLSLYWRLPKRVDQRNLSAMRFLIPLILIFNGFAAHAQTCDRRYDHAVALIDQAYTQYGTLYSGGRNYGSVGPTLEIYRLLMDLPDSGMATLRDRNMAFVDPGGNHADPTFADQTLTRSLPRISDPLFWRDMSDGSTDSEVLLNLLTVVGPYPGWWLTPDAPHLTPVEQVIASHAHDDALDWLLSVQAASARPFALSWHLQTHHRDGRLTASRAVFDHSLAQFNKTESLAWLLAVMLNREDERWEWRRDSNAVQPLVAIEARVADLQQAVLLCQASPAEYLVFAIGTYEQLRLGATRYSGTMPDDERLQLLPPILRRMAAVQLAKFDLRQNYRSTEFYSPSQLRFLATDPRFDRWLSIGRSYQARTLDELIAVNADVALDPKTVRLLNILSADDLLTFAQSRDTYPDGQRDIITTAFLRFFALRQDDKAAGMVDEIIALWPDLAEELTHAWGQDSALGYRLAQVVLTLPEPRVVLVPRYTNWQDPGAFEDPLQSDYRLQWWTTARRSRDLPMAMRTGGFLTRDLRYWMETVGSNPAARGSVLSRARMRGLPMPDALIGTDPALPENASLYYQTNLGPARFAGWDELARLGPEIGLANRLGQELVLHARQQTAGPLQWLAADRIQLANQMVLVIDQGRRMIHGDLDGQPLGQAAFDVLHGALRFTDAAAQTPHWFVCREKCEP